MSRRQVARARRNRSLQKNGAVSSAGLGKNKELLGLTLPCRSKAAKDFRRIDEFLAGEGSENASRHLRPRFQREAGEGTYDRFAVRSLAELRGSEWDGDHRGVH